MPSTDTILIFLSAVINAYVAWRINETHKIVLETKAISLATEINTNSMKDALVKSTGESAHAAGLEQGREEGRHK